MDFGDQLTIKDLKRLDRVPPAFPTVCEVCGAMVGDQVLHREYHVAQTEADLNRVTDI